jgi:putative lipoprotein
MRLPAAVAVLAIGLWPKSASAESDPWWGRDKALHFGVSAGLAGGGYAISSLVFDQRWQRATAGATFALTLGAGKELYDLSGAGDASFKDFAWDVAGTAVGTGVALVIDVLIAGDGSDDQKTSALIRF